MDANIIESLFNKIKIIFRECKYYDPWINPLTKEEVKDEFNPSCSFC